MDDYISRKAVLSKCQQIWSNADETTEIGVAIINIVDELADFVENIPSADVQPVKHGRWIMLEKTELFPTGLMAVTEGHVLTKTSADKPFTEREANIVRLKEHRTIKIPYCSICQNYGDDEYDKTPYCPYCGARMDGDSE